MLGKKVAMLRSVDCVSDPEISETWKVLKIKEGSGPVNNTENKSVVPLPT